jgi:hypothetical protein
MGAGDVAPKDVIITIVGAAAALGGFVLVFLGIVISGFASYRTEEKPAVRGAYRIEGGLALGAFSLSLITVALGLAWLAYGQIHALYTWSIRLLLGDLGVALALGGAATYRALRD